jgi:ATP-grasp domain/L-amino acid ligase C-terminal domain 2/ATP-grasp N-terminal domain
MILCTTTGYQTRAFVEAAGQMGVECVFGSDRCHVLEDPWNDGALPLRFEDPDSAALQIAGYAQQHPVHAILALGDAAAPAAARASELLRLPGHPPLAADICRNKYRSRERLQQAGLNIPRFARFPLNSDPDDIASHVVQAIGFPCVLKPLALAASRGVIRANNPSEFVSAFDRIRKLLRSPEVQVMREEASGYIQVEEYIDGAEIAVEGLVVRGQPRVLAILSKPLPLQGPFFEETIYVTPAKLPNGVEDGVHCTLEHAIAALGLFHGPFHAELRMNGSGIWPIEIAARSIGGLCSRALRFRSAHLEGNISLESVIIALCLGEDISSVEREETASGVMMIPVERGGICEGIEGVEDARQIPGIEEVIITAKPGQQMIAWPEGHSYPGFIFARGSTPHSVEHALKCAHRKLRFQVSPRLPVVRA